MATTTSNLGLTKAADGESYSVTVVNNNLQKIDDSDIAAAFAGGQTNLSETLKNCTGTIADHLKYHMSGDICVIEGRVIINNYVRTGANPGVTFSLPNGKKAKKNMSIACAGISGKTGTPIRFGENTRVIATANSATVTVDVTETQDNMGDADKAIIQVFPVAIRVIS